MMMLASMLISDFTSSGVGSVDVSILLHADRHNEIANKISPQSLGVFIIYNCFSNN